MSAPYHQKAVSLRDRRVFYVLESFRFGKRMVHTIDAETGEDGYLPIKEFRDLYVKDSVPNLPSAVRAILDAAPSWYEWRDRRKAQKEPRREPGLITHRRSAPTEALGGTGL